MARNWASVEGPWSPRSGRKLDLRPVDEDRETESFRIEGQSVEKPVGKPVERAGGKPVKKPAGKPAPKPASKPARESVKKPAREKPKKHAGKPAAKLSAKRAKTSEGRSKGGEEMKLHPEMMPSAPASMSPLDEYPRVRQIEGEGFRRWFTNGYFDLIAWYKDDGTTMVGFQLCFESRALTWTVEHGYDLSTIDDGEQGAPGSSKMTPVLVAGGDFKPRVVAERFREAAVSIDGKLADFILARIVAFHR